MSLQKSEHTAMKHETKSNKHLFGLKELNCCGDPHSYKLNNTQPSHFLPNKACTACTN